MKTLLIFVTLLIVLISNLAVNKIYALENMANVDRNQSLKTKIIGLISPTDKAYIIKNPTQSLNDMWGYYKSNYITVDGRTVDYNIKNSPTTSQNQAYTLLRSVLSKDKDTFETTWNWTRENLQSRNEDKLFVSEWGYNEKNGTWEILKYNSSSDANQDIAMALIIASKTWNKKEYLHEAEDILNDIWDYEVIYVSGRPYLLPGTGGENNDNVILMNPSHYTFHSYNTFAEVNPENDWMELKTTGYMILTDESLSRKLPSAWIELDASTLKLTPTSVENSGLSFSDSAMMVPYRVTADLILNNDKRAYNYIDNLSLLADNWDQNNRIVEKYSLDGIEQSLSEQLRYYGALLPYFKLVSDDTAEDIIEDKIGRIFNPTTGGFTKDIGSEGNNMMWFGIALFNQMDSQNYNYANVSSSKAE